MDEVFIVGAARTPIGKFMGSLSGVPATKLGATAVRAAVDRAGIAPGAVDDVVIGNVVSAGIGQAPARQAALGAGIPDHASAATINKVCASGLEAINVAFQQIRLGESDVVVAGGMENMSAAPHLFMGSRAGIRLGAAQLEDAVIRDGLWCPFEDHHMGNAAEAIAETHGIGRAEMDEYSFRSHEKAVASATEGRFDAEIVAVEVTNGKGSTQVSRDESPRPDSSLDRLSTLRPAFLPEGLVTAGNAPGMTDGAAAVVLAGERAVDRHGLTPIARVVAHATVGTAPLWLFDAPVGAVRRLLEKTGTTLDEYDLFEINEAFAAQVLANGKVLGWNWD